MPWYKVTLTKEYEAIVDASSPEKAQEDTFEHTWRETGRDYTEAVELTPEEAAAQPWPTDYPAP